MLAETHILTFSMFFPKFNQKLVYLYIYTFELKIEVGKKTFFYFFKNVGPFLLRALPALGALVTPLCTGMIPPIPAVDADPHSMSFFRSW